MSHFFRQVGLHTEPNTNCNCCVCLTCSLVTTYFMSVKYSSQV